MGRIGAWDHRYVLVAAGAAIALTFFVAFSFDTPAPARPVTLATGDWAPFVGPDLSGGGPVALVVSESLRRAGYEPIIETASWPLTLERVDRGDAIGAFPFIATESRRDEYLVSDNIVEFEYVLFYHRDAFPDGPEITDAGDLADLRIGRAEGYEVWDDLDEAVETFVDFQTSEEAFRALAAGDIDLLPEGLLPGRAILQTDTVSASADSFGVLERNDDPLLGATESLHVLLPRTDESAELLPKLNGALAAVKESRLYADALGQLALPPAAELVELVPDPDTGVARVYEEPEGGAWFMAPAGTRATVLEWPTGFSSPTTGSEALPRVRVKLLNGPARGLVVHVEASTLRLVEVAT